MFDVLHRHVYEEIVPARKHEHRKHLGQRGEGIVDGVDDMAGQRPNLHSDQGLYSPVQRGQVHPGRVAGDDTVLAKQPDPLQAGRRRNANRPGQVAVGLPGVTL